MSTKELLIQLILSQHKEVLFWVPRLEDSPAHRLWCSTIYTLSQLETNLGILIKQLKKLKKDDNNLLICNMLRIPSGVCISELESGYSKDIFSSRYSRMKVN